MGLTQAEARLRTRQATPPPAFLFHSQCQTSRRQNGQDPQGLARLYLPHPSGRDGRPVCDEARGICPGPLARQPPFSKFFQRSEKRRKPLEKEPTALLRARSRGPRQDRMVGGRWRYTPRAPV